MKNAVTLSENLGESILWFDGLYLDEDMPYPTEVVLPPSMWLDCRDWADVHVQLEYTGTGGLKVYAMLQTTVVPVTDLVGDDDPNDVTTWIDMQDDWVVVNPVATIQATSVGTFAIQLQAAGTNFWPVPPMGVLRLKFNLVNDVGGLKGRLRAVVVGKKRG